MKEFIKTIAFLAVGLILGLSALAVNYMSKPKDISEFESVGEEFFPDFRSPEEAKYLQVAAYDEAASKAKTFRVEFKDGLWRIPSHYDYPAEAKDRLVKTATSVIGIRREALAGRRENEHERFGVVDPLKEDITDPKAVGKRITLGGADEEEPLADYIVGKQVEEDDLNDEQLREIRGQAAKQPMFYVRRPNEVETYIATLNLDVSTKFSEWIEPDLLKLDANSLRQLVIDKYTVEHREEEVRRGPLVMLASRPVKVEEEVNQLTRDSDFGPWNLDGLNEETEEVDSSKISALTRSLDSLEILGVRPRFEIDGQPLLTADLQLRIPPSMRSDRNAIEDAIDQVQSDLASKGFAIDVDQSGDEPKARLLSDKGEFTCASSEGVVYHLHFGNVFLGSDAEIEIGGNEEKTASADEDAAKSSGGDAKPEEGEAQESAEDKPDAKSPDDSSSGEDANSDGADNGDDKDPSPEKKSRYLLVRVDFDPAMVDGKPFKPIKPIEPKKSETPETPAPEQPEKRDLPDESKPDDGGDKKDADDAEQKSSKDQSGKNADEADQSDDEKADNKKSADEDSSCVVLSQDDAENAQAKDAGESKQGDADDEEKAAEPGKTESDDPATDKPAADQPATDDDTKQPADDQANEDKSESEKPEPKPDPEAEYQRALADYHFALQQYEQDEMKYEEDLQAYEKKLEQGKEKVEELNERFAAWYYVISAENLENIRLSRADLVKEKPKPEETPGETEEPGTTDEPDTKEKPKATEDPGAKKEPGTTEESSKKGDAQPPQDSEKKDGDKSAADQPSPQDADKGQGGDEKKGDDRPDGGAEE